MTLTAAEVPPVNLIATLSDPRMQADGLWELCAWLLAHDPTHRTAEGFVMLSRHRDVLRLLSDPDVVVPEAGEFERQYRGMVRPRSLSLVLDNISMSNPPRHTRMRRIAARGFTPRVIAGLRASALLACESLVSELTERLSSGETVDLHTDFAKVFALNQFSDLTGVPPGDRQLLAGAVTRMVAFADPSASTEQLAEADRTAIMLADYFDDLARRRRAAPQDDLISAWASDADLDVDSNVARHVNAGADRFSGEELVNTLWMLWQAGFESTAAAISHGAISMIRHPAAAAFLGGTEDEVNAFVNESLRYEPPGLTTGVFRVANRDLMLDESTTIPSGTRIMGLIGAANRDPAVYPDPDRFDPRRAQPPLLTFGRGVHTCFGTPLARMSVNIALRLLYKHLPDLELVERPQRLGGLPVLTFSRVAVASEGRR